MVIRILIATVVLATLVACGPGPDSKSGGDGFRHQAKPLQFNEWVTDEDGINYSKGDRTDWKKLVVSRRGTLFIRISCDNKKAFISAALYNKYGKRLIEKSKKKGFTDHIRFEGEVMPGNYFLRIYARKSRDKTVYSIIASMEGEAGVGDIPRPE